ncbi:MAG: hypothetical protein COB20_13160 [SAR86 cluster bacterium]|uniref:BD-FAE-like domain-containing protein n=1 Tax=SAR86 cluster bacterium TaxID=2030880 RepID=A0A2A4WY45_9GAMM|nr:MAG: hypothetical protein COB20_13160 [SAR86 cluster bacterium]
MTIQKIIRSLMLALFLISGNLSAQDTDITRHQIYGHRDGMAMFYDVEVPANANGLGIVLIVSGGFVSGEDNLNIIEPFWNILLENGYTLFQIYHPAHPVYRIPDAFAALKIGVQHIQDNSAQFDVDSERLGIFGVSTGGFLSLLLGMSVEADERSAYDFKAIVAMMPPVDVLDVDFDAELFGARYLDFDPALYSIVSPINYVSADDPPTLLIHGTTDQAVPYERTSVRMQSLLEEAGVKNRLVSVDAGHEIFPEPYLSEAHSAILEWFERHL